VTSNSLMNCDPVVITQGGLISSERAGSGHRRYPRSVLRRIAFIVFAQRVGLTLEEIATELAKLPADRIPTQR
jgi:MerR family redox-sensitive transcriptional activator SoxR